MGSNVTLPFVGKSRSGLSRRLLWLTIFFVMLAEILILVPSIANFRNTWLNDRLAAARTAALALEASNDDMIPEALAGDLLKSIGAESLALKVRGTRRLLATSDMPPQVDQVIDMRQTTYASSIADTVQLLAMPAPGGMLGVIGDAAMAGEFVEITLRTQPLREALQKFAVNILLLSLTISVITAALVYLSLERLIVRPVKNLTRGILHFADAPQDGTRLLPLSDRSDEIGQAEVAVRGMEETILHQLKQRENLAALGLAVSKINHDLRNILTSAQLLSDRLAQSEDPLVKRFAPRLVATLDRAIQLCSSTLEFGKAEERPPELAAIHVRHILDEVWQVASQDLADQNMTKGIHWQNSIAPGLHIVADRDYLFRIMLNLARNAIDAMKDWKRPDRADHVLGVDAGPRPEGGWWVEITDTGPGIPEAMRSRLFEPFHGSTKPGGTGLGLSIAHELARGHGGSLSLAESRQGCRFRLELPAPSFGR
jgi:signal transduction histidine kinase